MPKVAVIDDDQSIREMLVGALKTNGHQTFTASDGDEGLELIRRIRPDLVFLDLMMPRMSGYEVLDELQTDGDLGNIPVIILTALDHRSQIVEGLQKGANDYITKPFSLQELLARASVQLRIQDLEREIRSSEAYHRALFEHAADPEIVLDRGGRILRVNEAAISLLALSEESLINTRLHDLIAVQDRPEFAVAFSGCVPEA